MSTRDRFPGLSDGWARLDGAAGTLVVDTAIEAMTDYLRSPAPSNLGGTFAASAACDELVESARATVGALLGVGDGEVVFGPNSTTLVLGFTRALGRTLSPGDRIVCTQLDHDSNVSTWMAMAADVGAEVVMWNIDETGHLRVEALEELLAEGGVRWVAVTGASNLTGAVPPITEIAAAAHHAGAKVHLDAVARVPHLRTHRDELGVDSLMSSAYKWFGPHVGCLVLSNELLETVEPYRVRPADYPGARRWETGTPSFETIAGVRAAAEFLLEEPEPTAHEQDLLGRLETGLAELPGITVYAPDPADERCPTTIFNVGDRHPDEVAAHLASRQVSVWSGDSYARELIAALGLTARGGAVRASLVRYNDTNDVDRLLEAVAELT
jgi:cysteine desulfurase family protein (TIGR01976 family)